MGGKRRFKARWMICLCMMHLLLAAWLVAATATLEGQADKWKDHPTDLAAVMVKSDAFNGDVDLRVSQLAAFKFGPASHFSARAWGGGVGGGCFIGSAAQATDTPLWVLVSLIVVAIVSGVAVQRKK